MHTVLVNVHIAYSTCMYMYMQLEDKTNRGSIILAHTYKICMPTYILRMDNSVSSTA